MRGLFSSTAVPLLSLGIFISGCRYGYATRTCSKDEVLTNGGSDGTSSVCSLITCPSLSSPINGSVSYSPSTSAPFQYQTTASYTCNTGYTLSGGDAVRTCSDSSSQSTGAWSGTAPACIPIVPRNVRYSPDSFDCDVVFISWELWETETIPGALTHRVVVTLRSTGEVVRTETTTGRYLKLTSLNCCVEYDFTVSAGIDGLYGEPLPFEGGFRTRPDLSIPVKVYISSESDTSLSVTWVESAATKSTHLPNDTYTVVVTPDCRYHQPTGPVPPPQTIPYDATPHVIVENLEPVRYQVRLNTVMCGFSLSLFAQWKNLAPYIRCEDREVPSIVATRWAEDPSQANIQWSSSSPEATEILIYSATDPNALTSDKLVRSIPLNSTTKSQLTLSGFAVCAPYWFVVRRATCTELIFSPSHKLELTDTADFELMFSLQGQQSCADLLERERAQVILAIENAMNETLLSASCLISVTCFTDSNITCTTSDSSAIFSSRLVGHGPERNSSIQRQCLRDWLTTAPSVVVSDGLKPVRLSAVPTPGPDDCVLIPTYAIALSALGVIVVLLLLISAVAGGVYQHHKRKRVKTVHIAPAVTVTYDELPCCTVEAMDNTDRVNYPVYTRHDRLAECPSPQQSTLLAGDENKVGASDESISDFSSQNFSRHNS